MSQTRPDVLIVAPIRPRQMEALRAAYTLHRLDEADDPSALLSRVGPDIRAAVTTGSAGFPADLFDRLPNLEIVATSSVGTDKIDLDACVRRGIVVTNTPGVLADDVADLAMLLILATHRRLVEADLWVRQGVWKRQGAFPLTTSLAGRKIGILGLGSIGNAVAERCRPFRMDVGYCTRTQRDVPMPYFASPIKLARWCDVLVTCVPGGPDTHGLVSAEVLGGLGSTGTFINVARGEIVDETALIRALTAGTIANAGLDVFRAEPAPSPDLTRLPNVVLSPHHASGTETTRDRMAQLVAENLESWFSISRPLTPVTC